MTLEYINQELQTLKERKNYRSLPPLMHEDRDVLLNGQRMLNLSSNDYLGLANDISLREEFLKNRGILEHLSDSVKNHYRDRLGHLADREGPQRGDALSLIHISKTDKVLTLTKPQTV